MFDRMKNYIVDNEFRLTLYTNMIHIINYTKILSLEEDRIVIKSLTKKVLITGKNMHLNKLLDDEILVKGEILNIEVSNV